MAITPIYEEQVDFALWTVCKSSDGKKVSDCVIIGVGAHGTKCIKTNDSFNSTNFIKRIPTTEEMDFVNKCLQKD